jgi:hypothetical protein
MSWKWTGCSDSDYIEVRTKLGSLFVRLASVDRSAMSKGERAAYEANARLIAAAPELLAQLRNVEDVAAKNAEHGSADWAFIRDTARAAIAKAEGLA